VPSGSKSGLRISTFIGTENSARTEPAFLDFAICISWCAVGKRELPSARAPDYLLRDQICNHLFIDKCLAPPTSRRQTHTNAQCVKTVGETPTAKCSGSKMGSCATTYWRHNDSRSQIWRVRLTNCPRWLPTPAPENILAVLISGRIMTILLRLSAPVNVTRACPVTVAGLNRAVVARYLYSQRRCADWPRV